MIKNNSKQNEAPELKMKRIKKHLAILGNPQNALTFVHVAGTNGKGSTSTYLAQFLQQTSRKKVGLFLSPHLHEINERISINQKTIPDDDFIRLFYQIKKIIGEKESDVLVQFEWLFLIALIYFNEKKADIVILEVGIGGLYDTTNAIDCQQKIAATITNISFDHTSILGNTLDKIAIQKAGISCPNLPVFLGEMDEEISCFLVKLLKEKNAVPISLDSDSAKKKFTAMPFCFPKNIANYQKQNIKLAFQIYYYIYQHIWQKNFSEHEQKIIGNIIQKFQMPLRFEQILCTLGAKERRLIFDGAHNVAGIKKLKSNLLLEPFKKNKIIIAAIMEDKDYLKIFNILQSISDTELILYDFRSVYVRAFNPQKVKKKVKIFTTKEGLFTYLNLKSENIFVFTGSFYFISYIRTYIKKCNL